MNSVWRLAPAQPALAAQISRQHKVSPLLAQCLLNRGLCETETILAYRQPRLKQLGDPFSLPNMTTAVDRILLARQRGEPVTIFGDYDVDGVTSVALLLEALRGLGCQVHYHLPHRIEEGYGLSGEGVERCLREHPTRLMLAVDCGSSSAATITDLQGRGIDVVVLDHHQVSTPPPAAKALVNPQLRRLESPAPGPAGPSSAPTELCSVGLAFKLAHALVKRGRLDGLAPAQAMDIRAWLDLVALGTVADVVPLTGENRILVAAGLDRLATTLRPGLQALKAVAQVASPIRSHAVAFQLAPRLNAAGRLENAELALGLLLARDRAQAEPLARRLEAQNRERQRIERTIAQEVTAILGAKFKPETDYVIVEGQGHWHIGVVGIVASRILRQFHRPTLILGGPGEEWRGSGRSVEGFDLAAALQTCDDLLLRHGGHALAAGLTVPADRVAALRTRLNDLAHRTFTPDQLQTALHLDAAVDLGDLTCRGVEELEQLEPVGQGNPPVQLCSMALRCQRPPQRLGREQQHLKLWVTNGRQTFEAVAWAWGQAELPAEPFDLAFAPRLHEFNGQRSVQLRILDWRKASASPS